MLAEDQDENRRFWFPWVFESEWPVSTEAVSLRSNTPLAVSEAVGTTNNLKVNDYSDSRPLETAPPLSTVNDKHLPTPEHRLSQYAGKGLVQRAGNAVEASTIMGHDDGGKTLMETLKAYTATANGERADDFGKTVFPAKHFAAEEELCESRLRSCRPTSYVTQYTSPDLSTGLL